MATVPKSDRITIITLASATAGPFDLTFRLFDDDALAVFVNDVPRTDFIIISNYVDGFDDNASITFDVDLSVSDVVRVHSDMTAARGSDYQSGPGLTEKMNIELGRVWAVLSDLKRDSGRSVKFFQSVSPIALEAGRTIVSNDDATGLIMGPTVDEISNAQAYAVRAETAAARVDLGALDDAVEQTGQDREATETARDLIVSGFKISNTGFVEKIEAQTWVGRGYLKAASNGVDFKIGFEHANNKASEYELGPSSEGFFWIQPAYVGESVGQYILPDLFPSDTNSFKQSTTNNYYASKVGDAFTFDFVGTGFYFNHLAATTGGLWNFSVEGGADIPISTYSAVTVQDKKQLVIDGLPYATHSVVATYAGADPANPPSSGGVGRGWMKYDFAGTGVSTATAIPEFPDTLTDKGIELNYAKPFIQAMGSGTVLDFAIKAKPVGMVGETTWVPYHAVGSEGATQRDIVMTITVDGKVIDNDASLLDGSIIFKKAVFTQSYTAYNNNDDTNTPLWNGVFTHAFEAGIMTTSHTIEILNQTYSDAGYVGGKVAANSNHMDKVSFSNGFSYAPTSDWIGPTQNRLQDNLPRSVCYQSTTFGAFLAADVNISDALAIKSFDDPVGDVFVQSRTSNLVKTYWQSFTDRTLEPGEYFRCTTRYFIGPELELLV